MNFIFQGSIRFKIARGKAAGIFNADLARALSSVTRDDWELIKWIEPPKPERFINDLMALGEKLVIQ